MPQQTKTTLINYNGCPELATRWLNILDSIFLKAEGNIITNIVTTPTETTVTLSDNSTFVIPLVDISNKLDKGNYPGTAETLKQEIDLLNQLLASNDLSLDEMQEVVDFIKANRNDLNNLSISNIAGLVDALDTKIDKPTTATPNPLKVLNEVGNYIFPPSIKKSTVLIDSVNGSDSLGVIGNLNAPFQTIQGALNKFRDRVNFQNSDFLIVEFAESGTYTFEYLTTPNVIFQSPFYVTVKAVSTGKHFTANLVANTDNYYLNYKGSLILDMVNGIFEIEFKDRTLSFAPSFQLDNLIIKNCKLIKSYLETKLYSWARYVYPVFSIFKYVDLNGTNIELNTHFIRLHAGSYGKLNTTNILIKGQHLANDATATAIDNNIIVFYCASQFEYSNISFLADDAVMHPSYNYQSFIIRASVNINKNINVGDVKNNALNGIHWTFFYGITYKYKIVFNNSNFNRVNGVSCNGIVFLGEIKSMLNAYLSVNSYCTFYHFKGFVGNFGYNATMLNFYQQGKQLKGEKQTAQVIFENTRIDSVYTFFRGGGLDIATHYSRFTFVGENIWNNSGTTNIIDSYLYQNSAILMLGKLISNKTLPNYISVQHASDTNYYTEIT